MNATDKNARFEIEKNQLIELIVQRNATINQLLQNNHRVHLLGAQHIRQLEEISQKNEKFRYKLESNEFEIAIVGLEKAGKSTFANALIKSNILPSAPERCTFTSTRLISGSNKASVQFYTEAEFEEIFQALLKEVGYGVNVDNSVDINNIDNKSPVKATAQDIAGQYLVGLSEAEEKELLDLRRELDEIVITGQAYGNLNFREIKELRTELSSKIAELEKKKQSKQSNPTTHTPPPPPPPPPPSKLAQKSTPRRLGFREISVHEFEKYFNELETKDKNLYKNHIGKTDEEIKDIIKCRDRLILTGGTKNFTGEELKTDAFQSYIKGDNHGKDTAKPRSVRRIEIESAELQELEHAIIYDVPGFDSPTAIHMRQTEERLKAADAIILVTNVGTNPSLQGTTLSVITKNTDDDGIALRDKLFVFGNQIDRVNDEAHIQGNTEILISDVEKYKIGERRRVFTGSAYQYLSEENIIPLAKLKNKVDSNIDKIRNALINYYQVERFEILKRKVQTNARLMQETLADIIAQSNFDPNFSETGEQSKIIKSAYKAVEKNIEWALKKFQDNLKSEIENNKYFTYKFMQSIRDEYYFPSVTEDQFEMQRILSDDSVRCDLAINKINQTIRSNIHKKYLEEFTHLVKNITDEKAKEITIRLLGIFVDAICLDDLSVRDELELPSKNYIHKITHDVSHSYNSFTYLIERFSRDIFDALLSAPLLSTDRSNRFKASQKEFAYLDSYYSNGKGHLFNLILIQKKQGLFNIDKIDGLYSIVQSVIKVTSSQNVINTLNEMGKLLHNTNTAFSIKDNAGIDSIVAQHKPSSTTDDVLQEINSDIEHLRDVLQLAVIPAANLELAFINGVDKQIKRLIAAFNERDSLYAQDWDDFISKIIPIVKRHELGQINDRIEAHKLHEELLAQIQAIVHPGSHANASASTA